MGGIEPLELNCGEDYVFLELVTIYNLSRLSKPILEELLILAK